MEESKDASDVEAANTTGFARRSGGGNGVAAAAAAAAAVGVGVGVGINQGSTTNNPIEIDDDSDGTSEADFSSDGTVDYGNNDSSNSDVIGIDSGTEVDSHESDDGGGSEGNRDCNRKSEKDSDSDDEIEYLLTVRPSSPMLSRDEDQPAGFATATPNVQANPHVNDGGNIHDGVGDGDGDGEQPEEDKAEQGQSSSKTMQTENPSSSRTPPVTKRSRAADAQSQPSAPKSSSASATTASPASRPTMLPIAARATVTNAPQSSTPFRRCVTVEKGKEDRSQSATATPLGATAIAPGSELSLSGTVGYSTPMVRTESSQQACTIQTPQVFPSQTSIAKKAPKTSNTNNASDAHQGRKITTRAQVESASSAVTASVPKQPNEIRAKDSAYLQSLAEICSTILQDRRWRYGRQRQHLFSQEHGDDLSAAVALAKMHEPDTPLPPPTNCTCLLCHRSTTTEGAYEERAGVIDMTDQDEDNDAGQSNPQNENDTSADADTSIYSDDGHQGDNTNGGRSDHRDDGDPDDALNDEEAQVRALLLYSRMFSRKGPWFRIDDLFRYYDPKVAQTERSDTMSTFLNNIHAQGSANATGTPNPHSHGHNRMASTPPKNDGIRKRLFSPSTPKHSHMLKEESSQPTDHVTSRNTSDQLDNDSLDRHLHALHLLLDDIAYLKRTGLIRSFQSEEECGKTVGQVKGFRLLTVEEQGVVLKKLGGKKLKRSPSKQRSSHQQPQQQSRRSRHGARTSDPGNGKPTNLIWKQMKEQKPFSFFKASDAASPAYLPVICHVNRIITDSLGQSMAMKVLGISQKTSTPAVGRHIAGVRAKVGRLLQEQKATLVAQCGKARMDMSWRLCEKPLTTLHRMARLYLCATDGPGNMRSGGTSAWRTLPIHDIDLQPVVSHVRTSTSPPGTHSWHTVKYPGKDHRFRMQSSNFVRSYSPYPVEASDTLVAESTIQEDEERDRDALQVFPEHCSFRRWEVCAEFRATCDYLIELNEWIHYLGRRREAGVNAANGTIDDHNPPELEGVCVDFLDVLDPSKREHFVKSLLFESSGNVAVNNNSAARLAGIMKGIDDDVRSLVVQQHDLEFEPEHGNRNRNHGHATDENGDGDESSHNIHGFDSQDTSFLNDCELVLAVIGILLRWVLQFRIQEVSREEARRRLETPWLRHLTWEGCMACMLWDIVAIMEKRKYHKLAIDSLQVLLFGSTHRYDVLNEHHFDPHVSHSELKPAHSQGQSNHHPRQHPRSYSPPDSQEQWRADFVLSLMSRRSRGKAFERLLIDTTHHLRIVHKQLKLVEKAQNADTHDSQSHKQNVVKSKMHDTNQIVASLAEALICTYGRHGIIPFSAIRTLARKLKQPLAQTLAHTQCFEVQQLGHRFDNNSSNDTGNGDVKIEDMNWASRMAMAAGASANHHIEACMTTQRKSTYADWVPITDYVVANAMRVDETLTGKRCSYIGADENERDYHSLSSLNVEQLAMEYYRTGPPPNSLNQNATETDMTDHSEQKHPCHALSGWQGWHDEGVGVRTLFRILCSGPILGMDWGCSASSKMGASSQSNALVFLTPYQTAPHDLHVGAETTLGGASRQSFWKRRAQRIHKFLRKLSGLSSQQLSDLVHRSIKSRLEYREETNVPDPFIGRDIKQCRTLCLLAAGAGGRQLTGIFRNLFFDYRHYSGGLPDCTLVRALYEDENGDPCMHGHSATAVPKSTSGMSSVVDLGEWVGEAFSAQHLDAVGQAKFASMLMDREDEFLGCDKIGESKGRPGGKSTHGSSHKQNPRSGAVDGDGSSETDIITMPERLTLQHNGRCIRAECMMVEVKSHNDRLDARQEDWLNILDLHGNARVCKFVKSPSDRKKHAPTKRKRGSEELFE